MSQYVKRCARCRDVRGISSFGVIRDGGGRADVCRWCEERSGRLARSVGKTRLTLGSLRRREGELRAKLAEVRAEVRLRETELFLLSEERLRANGAAI